jgi:hypothetical protein
LTDARDPATRKKEGKNEETVEPESEADETGGNADKKREKTRAATEGKSDGGEEKRDGVQEEESDGGEERHRLSEESDFCSFILFVSFLFIPAPEKKKKKKKFFYKYFSKSLKWLCLFRLRNF